MGKVQRIAVGRKPGQRKLELPDEVQVSLAELGNTVKEGLLAFAAGVGIEVFRTLLDGDVTAAAGPKGRHDATRTAYRHSRQSSSVVLGGRRVAMDRPRARRADGGGEVQLPTWQAFSDTDLLDELATGRMLAGLSTRRYPAGLEPVGETLDASGTSRSAVSRRFVRRTGKAMEELMARDLSGLEICAVVADGIEVGDHTLVCALGIDREGRKHVLGLREGTTENAAVCAGLLSNLVDRGLDASQGILFVIDGGKGLRKAIRQVFGSLGLVQRCRVHKQRNVTDHLPARERAWVAAQLHKSWAMPDPRQALAALNRLVTTLERRHPGAAASLREGLEEMVTINELGVSLALAKTLGNTNTIESANSVARSVMRNVKRWRDGAMAERWTAAGMLEAEQQFRRVKGYKDLPKLVVALRSRVANVSSADATVA
jgi:transposase-like protein